MAELVIGKECRKTWDDLHNGTIGWTLWSMGEDFKHPTLDVLATGSKGFTEMKSYLTPTACMFGGFRVRAIDVKRGIRSVRDRFVSFMYAGTDTSTIKRARFSGHKPKVFPLMTGVSASFELVGTAPETFTMSQVARELIACCGAHQPTEYDFEDGGVYYVSGGPDGAVGEVAPKVSDSMKVFTPPPRPKPASLIAAETTPAPAPAPAASEEPQPLKLKENTTPAIDPATVPKNCCLVCGKRAYQQESVSIEGSLYHKKCIKCAHCNKVLSVGNFASLNHKFYCKPHFKQLFQSKGNYKFGDSANATATTTSNVTAVTPSEPAKPVQRELPKQAAPAKSATRELPKPAPTKSAARELPKPAPAKSAPRELPKPAATRVEDVKKEDSKVTMLEKELGAVEAEIEKLESEKAALERKLKDVNELISNKVEKSAKLKIEIEKANEEKRRIDMENEARKKAEEEERERKRIEEEEERERERKRIEEEEEEKRRIEEEARKMIEEEERKKAEEEKERERKRIEEEEEEEKRRIEEEEKEKERKRIEAEEEEKKRIEEEARKMIEEEEEKKEEKKEEKIFDDEEKDDDEAEIRALALKLIEEEEKRKQSGKTLTPEEEEEEERALAMKLLEQEEMEKKGADSSEGKYIHNGGTEKCDDFLCDKCHGLGCDCPLCQV